MTIEILSKTLTKYSTSIIYYFNTIFFKWDPLNLRFYALAGHSVHTKTAYALSLAFSLISWYPSYLKKLKLKFEINLNVEYLFHYLESHFEIYLL